MKAVEEFDATGPDGCTGVVGDRAFVHPQKIRLRLVYPLCRISITTRGCNGREASTTGCAGIIVSEN